MKLFLLGCTGFVGRELVPMLQANGHDLTIISRKGAKSLSFQQRIEEITFFQTNPADKSSWANPSLLKAIENSDGVINLCGEPIAEKRWSQNQMNEIKESRINTTKYLVNALNELKKPPSVLINGSAIGFYGSSPDQAFQEDSPS